MKRILIFVLLLLASLIPPLPADLALADQYGHNGSLIVFIKAQRAKYEVGEPILITFNIGNHTTVPLFVNKRLNPLLDLEWDIFSPSYGSLQMKKIPPVPLVVDDFVQLNVDEEFGKRFTDLAKMVNMPLKEGRYAIRLTYKNKEILVKKGETWTGVAATNLLWIEVKSSKKI